MKPSFVRLLAAATFSSAVLASFAWIDGPEGVAQEPKKGPAKSAPSEPLSAIHCIGCHGGPDTPAYKAYSQKEGDKPPRTDFILLTEYHTWKNDDLHADAYKNITPEYSEDKKPTNLAGRMQTILIQSPSRIGKNYHVNEAAECLTCHSVDRRPGPVADLEKAGDRFHRESGISCEACHGLVTEEWIGQHFQRSWREQDATVKTKSGQVDLRDPSQRAMKCASCHIGNKQEGKFVTHEMYAAGHPPLPPFELVTYCRDEPAHYRPLSKNVAIKNMPPEQQSLFYYQPGVMTDTRDFAIGTLAGFESTMKLLADDAKSAMESGKLLDFAHFDCYACHHDLKVDSDRRRPRPGVVPGRPVMRPWATETLQVVMKNAVDTPTGKQDLAKSNDELQAGLLKLNDAFNARPFGEAKTVSDEAKSLAEFCGQLRVQLRKVKYDREQTIKLYQAMTDRLNTIRKGDTQLDYDAAQQLAWAIVLLQEELGQSTKEFPALENVVRVRMRGAARESVEKRLAPRYEKVYGFRRDAFLDAADGILKAFDPK